MAFELPEDIRTFVDEVIESFVMWDLTICFAKKPDETGTAADIAQTVGRPAKDIAPHLQRMVNLGLVKVLSTGVDPVYSFDRTAPRAKAFQSFLNYNQFQENRLRVLSHLLQKGIR